VFFIKVQPIVDILAFQTYYYVEAVNNNKSWGGGYILLAPQELGGGAL
jgi:hypothetical protein